MKPWSWSKKMLGTSCGTRCGFPADFLGRFPKKLVAEWNMVYGERVNDVNGASNGSKKNQIHITKKTHPVDRSYWETMYFWWGSGDRLGIVHPFDQTWGSWHSTWCFVGLLTWGLAYAEIHLLQSKHVDYWRVYHLWWATAPKISRSIKNAAPNFVA